tara:strand:- start:1569 stop:3206 length:1638 start_codon:yes stop_codon:yes gene_type:complete
VIRFDKVSKIFQTDIVLKDINWEIKKGEKIGLIGSNGSGKTTQLKILMGELEPTTGSIVKEGEIKISYLKQEFDVNLNRSVKKELESAFSEIQLVSKKLIEIENKLKIFANSENTNQLNSLIRDLDVNQRKFESLGGYKIQSQIEKILPKLGFSSADAEDLVRKFSGGWQMKIALGKIMLQEPDLLLLDEPTNHLDLDTIRWLEDYLSSVKTSVILISHDRYFIDKVCNKIVSIEDGRSNSYKGNYSFYLEKKLLDQESQNKAYQIQQKQIESQLKYIERFRASATRSSQAKSKEKQLNKVERIINPIKKNKSPVFVFPPCPRSGQTVLKIKNLSHSFENKIIFFESNLKILAGEKIALLGPNGSGKSTLFNLIINNLEPEIGEITLGKFNVITKYYQQNQAEALDNNEKVIDLIFKNEPNWTQQKVRTYLGGFGFYKDSVFKIIRQLSGGEKARLALALIVMKPSNFLLLDEPTNHLDLPSKENLEVALKKYSGTVFFISHDRYFISKVANRIIEIEDYNLASYNGNYQYYLKKKLKHKNNFDK